MRGTIVQCLQADSSYCLALLVVSLFLTDSCSVVAVVRLLWCTLQPATGNVHNTLADIAGRGCSLDGRRRQSEDVGKR